MPNSMFFKVEKHPKDHVIIDSFSVKYHYSKYKSHSIMDYVLNLSRVTNFLKDEII
jgi:hypothetical protein